MDDLCHIPVRPARAERDGVMGMEVLRSRARDPNREWAMSGHSGDSISERQPPRTSGRAVGGGCTCLFRHFHGRRTADTPMDLTMMRDFLDVVEGHDSIQLVCAQGTQVSRSTLLA